MKRRIGIIGLGDIAQKVYLPLLSADSRVDIVGLCSRRLSTVEAVADQYRIKGRYDTLTALLAEEPDAVFVHSPTETHYEIVMDCLRHGVPVYVDKPLSYDYRESEAMAQLALERGLLLAVGFNRRFAPLYQQAKRWVEEAGGFDLCTVVKHRTKLQLHSAKHTLYDDLIHMLDLLLWLGGTSYKDLHYVEQADEEGRLILGSGSLVFDGAGAGAEGGAVAREIARTGQFSMSRRAGADLEKLELHGAGRSAEVVNMESAVWMEKEAQPRAGGFGSWDTILHRRGFAGVIAHFLDSLSEPLSCTIKADLTLPSHKLVERLNLHTQ